MTVCSRSVLDDLDRFSQQGEIGDRVLASFREVQHWVEARRRLPVEFNTRASEDARVENVFAQRLRRWGADACRLPGDCQAKLQEWLRLAEEDAEWLESAREAGDSERARASFAEVEQWVEARRRLPVEFNTRTGEDARV